MGIFLGPVVEVMPRTRRDHGCESAPSGGGERRGDLGGCDSTGGRRVTGGGGDVGPGGGGRRLPQIPKHQSKVGILKFFLCLIVICI